MKYLAAALISLFVMNCAPSIREDLKKEIDGLLLSHQSSTKVYENSSGITIKPWKVGQWALFKSTNDDGKVSIRKVSLTSKEGSAYWLETTTTTYFDKSHAAILIDGYDMKDYSKIRILKIKIKDEKGKVTELQPDQLKMAGGFDAIVQTIKHSINQGITETMSVPAGVFKNAKKVHVTVQGEGPVGFASEADVWYHYEVPIYGWFRSVSSGKALWIQTSTLDELLAFGDTGATSVFTE